MKKALVALNGERHIDLSVLEPWMPFECIIGADGGNNLLDLLGLSPDIILGDFDSSVKERLNSRFEDKEMRVYPTEKDFTDAELALKCAFEKGCDPVIVIGAFGGRIDHFLGNIGLLEKYPQLIFLDNYHQIELLVGETYKKIKKGYQFVSLIPFSKTVKGIDLEGFKYPLDDATIQRGESIGISNELVMDEGIVHIREGKVLLIQSNEVLVR